MIKLKSTSRTFGYARVSTDDQDTSIQIAALEAAGCINVFAEKKTGTKREGRTELETLLRCVREGDVILVTRIDRLARSMKDLQDIVYDLKQRGVDLKAVEQPIDTSNSAGKAFLDMLGVFAEFETNLRKERQMEGIKKAKAEGVYKGRKPSLDADKIKELKAEGWGPTDIADKLQIARSSVYRITGRGA
jgi:DNA invertase Pin-like site-specific DNA recombinase